MRGTTQVSHQKYFSTITFFLQSKLDKQQGYRQAAESSSRPEYRQINTQYAIERIYAKAHCGEKDQNSFCIHRICSPYLNFQSALNSNLESHFTQVPNFRDP